MNKRLAYLLAACFFVFTTAYSSSEEVIHGCEMAFAVGQQRPSRNQHISIANLVIDIFVLLCYYQIVSVINMIRTNLTNF